MNTTGNRCIIPPAAVAIGREAVPGRDLYGTVLLEGYDCPGVMEKKRKAARERAAFALMLCL